MQKQLTLSEAAQAIQVFEHKIAEIEFDIDLLLDSAMKFRIAIAQIKMKLAEHAHEQKKLKAENLLKENPPL